MRLRCVRQLPFTCKMTVESEYVSVCFAFGAVSRMLRMEAII